MAFDLHVLEGSVGRMCVSHLCCCFVTDSLTFTVPEVSSVHGFRRCFSDFWRSRLLNLCRLGAARLAIAR